MKDQSKSKGRISGTNDGGEQAPLPSKPNAMISQPDELQAEATKEARLLKRKFRSYFDRDPNGFRVVIRKAQGRVFRRKPGPKADPSIGKAAREHAAGKPWPTLYPKYIEGFATMSEYTRDYAKSGFQRKVNAYLQRHPVLKRKLRGRNVAKDSGPTE